MDDALKTRNIIYFNVESWFLFATLSKILATRLVAMFQEEVAHTKHSVH